LSFGNKERWFEYFDGIIDSLMVVNLTFAQLYETNECNWLRAWCTG